MGSQERVILTSKVRYGETPKGFEVEQEALELQPGETYVAYITANPGHGTAYFKIVKEGEGHKLIVISHDEMGDMISEARRKRDSP